MLLLCSYTSMFSLLLWMIHVSHTSHMSYTCISRSVTHSLHLLQLFVAHLFTYCCTHLHCYILCCSGHMSLIVLYKYPQVSLGLLTYTVSWSHHTDLPHTTQVRLFCHSNVVAYSFCLTHTLVQNPDLLYTSTQLKCIHNIAQPSYTCCTFHASIRKTFQIYGFSF